MNDLYRANRTRALLSNVYNSFEGTSYSLQRTFDYSLTCRPLSDLSPSDLHDQATHCIMHRLRAYRQAFICQCTATRSLNKCTHARLRFLTLSMFCVLQFVVAGTSAIHRIESLVPGSLLPITFAFAWPARGPTMAQTGPGTGPGRGPV